MARRALKLASWASVALAASGVCLYSNKYLDPNDFGAVRVGRAVATTAVISYDYLTSLRSVPYGSEEYLQLRSKVHLRSARRLCELCCANRGTFIKVGQHLGALDYLLPEEYTSTLKVLHSQAPQSSMEDVRQVIREDLGTEVLVLAVKQLFPEFEFMWLVDEAKKNLPLELDFLNEGRNAEKVAQMLKHFDFLKVRRHGHGGLLVGRRAQRRTGPSPEHLPLQDPQAVSPSLVFSLRMTDWSLVMHVKALEG
uniref:AarF domain-containing protein kinase 1 n=1 Tax=Moschus moschiferus TaxID=68415 RepID=A0A8C6D6F8_MOSMO